SPPATRCAATLSSSSKRSAGPTCTSHSRWPSCAPPSAMPRNSRPEGGVRVLHVDSGREFRGGQNQVRLLTRELARDPSVEQRLVTQRGGELARRAAAAPLDLRATLGLPHGARLAANVAELDPSKDQLTLIRAARAAHSDRPDLHWVVAGDGPERHALATEVRRLELADRVHLIGHISQADALLRESDVVVMSSRAEGLGTVVLHALALGKPVVATAGGGLSEIVPPRWLVPVGDADALARRVIEALDHPSPVPLPPQYTASAMAAGVLALYRSLV